MLQQELSTRPDHSILTTYVFPKVAARLLQCDGVDLHCTMTYLRSSVLDRAEEVARAIAMVSLDRGACGVPQLLSAGWEVYVYIQEGWLGWGGLGGLEAGRIFPSCGGPSVAACTPAGQGGVGCR